MLGGTASIGSRVNEPSEVGFPSNQQQNDDGGRGNERILTRRLWGLVIVAGRNLLDQPLEIGTVEGHGSVDERVQ